MDPHVIGFRTKNSFPGGFFLILANFKRHCLFFFRLPVSSHSLPFIQVQILKARGSFSLFLSWFLIIDTHTECIEQLSSEIEKKCNLKYTFRIEIKSKIKLLRMYYFLWELRTLKLWKEQKLFHDLWKKIVNGELGRILLIIKMLYFSRIFVMKNIKFQNIILIIDINFMWPKSIELFKLKFHLLFILIRDFSKYCPKRITFDKLKNKITIIYSTVYQSNLTNYSQNLTNSDL